MNFTRSFFLFAFFFPLTYGSKKSKSLKPTQLVFELFEIKKKPVGVLPKKTRRLTNKCNFCLKGGNPVQTFNFSEDSIVTVLLFSFFS